MPAAQDTLPFEVRTPLGPDSVVLKTITGEECLSGLYRYTLELTAADNSINLSKIAGKGISVSLPRPNGTEQYLHGIVSSFAYAGTNRNATTYFADLHPELWLLTLSSTCRIFQNKTTEQIIDHILQEAGLTAVIKNLSGSYKPRDFCVQYGETNFDFLSRLLQEDGIFYFFQHESDKHTLVLGDNVGAYSGNSAPGMIRWRESQGGWHDEETISECSIVEHPVTERYKTSDYNFEMPDTDLFTAIGAEASNCEIYDYPANALTLDDLEAKAKRMLECLGSPRRILRGTSVCRALRPGVRFTLGGHGREDLNTDYIVRRVSFRGDSDGSFTNSFEAFPAAVEYRPAATTPRPRIHGTQTATVVGKKGDEIMTDAYGRVRVHFHWDRAGKRDETASCPVRVAQTWAGKKWGSLFVPRVGQEVIVSFLDGNPDRPIIIGSVYNAAHPAPYDPGAASTRTTIKSNSSKGGGGFNEIRFEDKKDSEELYFHAQKDCLLDVGNDGITKIGHDETIKVKNDRSISIEEGDDSLTISKGDREITVAAGDETHDVKGSRTLTIGAEETHQAKAGYTINVEGNFVLKVKGNITIQTEDGSITIQGTSIETKAKQGLTNRGATIQNRADQTIESKAGISQNLEGGVSVSIKGAVVKLN